MTIAIDTSGSIGETELNAFSSELVSICSLTSPELVRVVWWDAQVHGEQVFREGTIIRYNLYSNHKVEVELTPTVYLNTSLRRILNQRQS